MSRILGPGATGMDVRELQIALNFQLACGTCQLAVDGIFGPGTQNAVRFFQRRAGLVADGIVGDKTWGKLFTTYTTKLTITPNQATTKPPLSQSPRTATPTTTGSTSSSSSPSSNSAPSSSGPPVPSGSKGWDNVQLTPGAQHTFSPWYITPDPTQSGKPDPFFTATFAISGTYRWFNRDEHQHWTREGAHLEIAPGLQFGYNSAYSLPYRGGALSPWSVQANVTFTYADLFAYKRYHLSPFAQVAAQAGPGSGSIGAGIGGQFSVDFIPDRLSLYLQGAGAFNVDPRNGQVQVGPSIVGGLIITLYPFSKSTHGKKQ